jgi:hypothetical protein
MKCNWQIRRAKAGHFVHIECGKRASVIVDGNPRCTLHAVKSIGKAIQQGGSDGKS